jgi:hypothetical protein
LPHVIATLLGCLCLLVMMGALGQVSKAPKITSTAGLKRLGIWGAAIAGLLLAAMLFLTGRGGFAIAALVFLAPLLWSWVLEAKPDRPNKPHRSSGRSSGRPSGRPAAGMSRSEALEVLGLSPQATPGEIRAAYLRLMATAHPDHGGSDWLAARINQARDVLLG